MGPPGRKRNTVSLEQYNVTEIIMIIQYNDYNDTV